jgi:dipeptidyl aminopeptidase/acylaminoacyl peptidase
MRAVLLAACLAVFGAGASAQTPQRVERGALRFENIPETPPHVRERLRAYVNIGSVSFADWMPDGGVLIYSRGGETTQLYRVDRPLAQPAQVTSYDERVIKAAVMPGGESILLTRDVGGDERFAGYRLDLRSGATERVTAPGTTNEGFIFSDDGERIAWAYAQSEDANADVFVGDAGGAQREIPEGEGAVSPLDFAADRSRVLLQRFLSASESNLFTLDLASGAFTRVTPEITASYSGGEFTPDGRSVITISDEGSQFRRLVRIDLPTGARQALTPNLGWDVESFDLAENGRTVAYVVNEAGSSSLHLMDLRSLLALPAPRLPRGVVSGLKFSPDNERLAFTLNSSRSPSDVYSWNVRARRLTRWTRSEPSGLGALTEPDLIRWRSFDEREINGFIFRPRRAGRHPVVIAIHGGPESQYRPIFSSTFQYWVNELGIAVIAPNVRGSSGYGRDFLALDNGEKREDAVRDIGALLDWIAAQPDLDAERVVVYGASYGGYMSLAAMTRYNDRLAGAVDIAGISNFASYLENPLGHRRDLRRAEYGDERDVTMRAAFERLSPLSNVTEVDRPILIIHGANDPRVPVSEAEQVVAAIRANGGEAWYLRAADEGHGFTRRENQQAQREAETMFFQRVLRLR